MLLAIVQHCWMLHSLGTAFHPLLAEDLCLDQHKSLFKYSWHVHCRTPWSCSFWWCLWLVCRSFDMCCSDPFTFLQCQLLQWFMYFFVWRQFFWVVHILKNDCNSFLLWWASTSAYCFFGSGYTPLDITSQRTVSLCICTDIYFYLVYNSLYGISAGFCSYIFHQYHILHLKCHWQCQIHLVGPWIFCHFFLEDITCWHHSKCWVWWICTCQIDMQNWLNMKISYWVFILVTLACINYGHIACIY